MTFAGKLMEVLSPRICELKLHDCQRLDMWTVTFSAKVNLNFEDAGLESYVKYSKALANNPATKWITQISWSLCCVATNNHHPHFSLQDFSLVFSSNLLQLFFNLISLSNAFRRLQTRSSFPFDVAPGDLIKGEVKISDESIERRSLVSSCHPLENYL